MDIIDDIGRELGRGRDNIVQVVKVFDGEYTNDQKELKKEKEKYDRDVQQYKDIVEEFGAHYVIDDEVFQMAEKNKFRDATSDLLNSLDTQLEKLNKDIENFKSEYDFIESNMNNDLFKVVMWVPMVVGGLVNDAETVLKFNNDSMDALKGILGSVLQIVTIVIEVVAIAAAIIAQQWWAVGFLITALIGTSIALIVTLDTKYAQGMIVHGLLSALDTVFNDWTVNGMKLGGKNTQMLHDPDYYSTLVGYIQLSAAILQIIGTLGTLASPRGYVALSDAGKAVTGTIMSSIPYGGTLAGIYKLYSMAAQIGDIAGMEEKYKELKAQLEARRVQVDERIAAIKNNKITQGFKEVEDMLTDTSDIIYNYVISGFSNARRPFDPESIIAANFGYRSQSGTIGATEIDNMFVSNNLAGSQRYMEEILFRTYA